MSDTADIGTPDKTRRDERRWDENVVRSVQGAALRPVDATQKWMLFVDGENFAIRAAAVADAEGIKLEEGRFYIPNVFMWLPGRSPQQASFQAAFGRQLEHFSVRSHYYTSLVGSHEDIAEVRRQIREVGFHPEVFKRVKNQPKAKGVDITITRDLLAHAFRGNYEIAVLVAGDADYVPVMQELKRVGVMVYVWFFRHPAAGNVEAVREECDKFFNLTPLFCRCWRKHLARQRDSALNGER
jgi:uncharacterized LabA/DUF88 family protein